MGLGLKRLVKSSLIFGFKLKSIFAFTDGWGLIFVTTPKHNYIYDPTLGLDWACVATILLQCIDKVLTPNSRGPTWWNADNEQRIPTREGKPDGVKGEIGSETFQVGGNLR